MTEKRYRGDNQFCEAFTSSDNEILFIGINLNK
jgi:hypothetical protein